MLHSRLILIHRFFQIAALPLLFFTGSFSQSKQVIDINEAGKIIVVDEGRKKPVQSFAKKKLIQISGRSTINHMSALEWLLKLMFEPGTVDTMQVFRISNPDIIDALGIEGPAKRRYRYTELYPVLSKLEQISNSTFQKEQADLLPYEREIVQLWKNIKEYNEIGSTFSAFDPFDGFAIHDSSTAASLQLETNKPYSYCDLIEHSSILATKMSLIGNRVDSLSPQESEVVNITRMMYQMSSQMGNTPPYLIAVSNQGETEWYSIWGYLNKSKNRDLNDKRILSFLKLRAAYISKDNTGFKEAVSELTQEKYPDYPNPGLEILYNNLNLFFWAKLILALAGVIALLSIFNSAAWTRLSGLSLICAAFLLQTSALLLRYLIQLRPPLASLYETFVFVAWIIVLLGIVLEIFQKRSIGNIIASLGGFLFLVISGRYTVNGDSFGVIVAVLNSSFWLTIHIVTISIGYAGFVISGLLGHIHLVQSAFKVNEKTVKSLSSTVYMFLLLGLAFTVAGTVLGGMWADHAWGRFWGWDPKENGALMIILWGSVVVHARKGNLIGPIGTSVCAIFGILMVMLAWIGVNLLGVGLHSYGFTYSGLSLLMAIFIFEFLFLISFGIVNLKKAAILNGCEKRSPH